MIKAIGKVGAGLLLAVMLGAGPATQPTTQDAGATFAADAFDLGSADFATRQAATMRLWWAGGDGGTAEEALREAAHSDNPEAAVRARTLLRDIDAGIAPTTPPAVIWLLDQYRAARSDRRPALIASLASGIDGDRVLLHLIPHESNPGLRASIDIDLAKSPRLPVALLLSEGKRAQAEALLARSPRAGMDAARAFVAYWQLRPDSAEKAKALQEASAQEPTRTRVLIEQARGDYASAKRDVARWSWGPLADPLATASADWPELQRIFTPVSGGQLRDFELSALAARLAGDRAAADRAASRMRTCPVGALPGAQPWRRAVALCYAGRANDAANLLIAAGDFDDAAQLLEPQLQYTQELALVDRAKSDPLQSARLQARMALLLHRLGKNQAAEQMLHDARGANRTLHDPETANLLCRAARRMGEAREADELLLESLPANDAPRPDLFDSAGFAQPIEADTWWRFLRHRPPGSSAPQALHALRALADGRVPAGELEHLAGEFEQWSASRPMVEQAAALGAESAAWKWAGRPDRQLAVLSRRAESFPSVATYLALGQCAEQQRNWSAAAPAYAAAAHYDPAYAPAVFLHGFALSNLGDAKQGRRLMDLAHELAGADDPMRNDLFTLAHERGLTADADRERDALLAFGSYDNLGMIHCLGVSSTDAGKRGDCAAAERYTDQTLWIIAFAGAAPVNRSMNVRGPAQIDRVRAQMLFAAHHFEAAMAEAKIWADADPDDSAALILLVRTADTSGAVAQGDALLDRSVSRLSEALQDFPDSPDLNNQIAWEESRCRRKLDDALIHAQRAVELDPQNAAILDTLAEVYYQRKQFQPAIEAMNRCIALEPSDEHFAKQLARFRLGLKTGVVDDE